VAADLRAERGDAAPVLTPPRPAPQRPAEVPAKPVVPAPGPARVPATYVAYDAVNERIALVTTGTGKVLRYLTPSKDRTGDFRISPDHRTVYLSEWGPADFDCVLAVDWQPFSMSTGAPQAGTLQLPALFARSVDGTTTAEVRTRRAGKDCERSLVVRDERSGVERSWPLPTNMLIQTLVISPDGRRVAWQSTDLDDSRYGPDKLPDDGVFEVGRDRAVLQLMPPAVEHADCARTAPQFDPRNGHVLLIDSCTGQKPALVEVDPATNRVLGRTPLDLKLDPNPFGGDGFVFSLSVDASGRNVLIEGSGSEVYALTDGRLRRLPGRHLSPAW